MARPGKAAQPLAHGFRHISRRLIASYIFDWVLIILTWVVGTIFSKIHGNRHAFALNDLNISYPHKPKDTISFSQLMVVALAAPALVTLVLSMLLVPGRTVNMYTPKALMWRRKLWEWNTAWMGLGVAVAGSFMVTEGLKDLAGKPRPDLLARCDPDLSSAALSRYKVGGLGNVVSGAALVVDWHICRNKNLPALNDGFSSWPSGHSSYACAGMLYLSLWLCSKFAISIPYLAPAPYERGDVSKSVDPEHLQPRDSTSAPSSSIRSSVIPARNQAAAPPVYLLILAFVPIGVALFICVSRYADYRHAGFDIISGAVLGAVFAYIGFRWYHMPIRRGAGWAWGARSRDRAFFVGVGLPSHVGEEGWESARSSYDPDIEDQEAMVTGAGIEDGSDGHPNHIQAGEHGIRPGGSQNASLQGD